MSSSHSATVRDRARRGLAVFLTLVVVSNAVFVWLLLSTGNMLWIFGLMWSVALSSVITRLVLREGFSDVSFRFGGRRSWRWVGFGLLYPLAVGFVSFGVAWLTGLAAFTPTAKGLVASIVPADAAPWVVFLVGLLLASSVGTVFGCLSAAGEEIGWRGYLLTRLIDAGVPKPVLVSGLIWGLWHTPVIIGGLIYADHPVRWLAVLVFMISAVAMSFVIARARLETGSIWPPIVLHAAYNSIIQGGFAPAASGPAAPVWISAMEASLLVAATLVVGAVLVSRGTWSYRWTPGQADRSPASPADRVTPLAGA
ncbi:MAG TPA: type II CAAX endopeptidase family protein [Pseudonocardia sp.]|jgi:membrane protease YdiL (CAAX protease family)